jgi:hypothetical protein
MAHSAYLSVRDRESSAETAELKRSIGFVPLETNNASNPKRRTAIFPHHASLFSHVALSGGSRRTRSSYRSGQHSRHHYRYVRRSHPEYIGGSHKHANSSETHRPARATGVYIFPNIDIGQYDLTVSASGYETDGRTGIVVEPRFLTMAHPGWITLGLLKR